MTACVVLAPVLCGVNIDATSTTTIPNEIAMVPVTDTRCTLVATCWTECLQAANAFSFVMDL